MKPNGGIMKRREFIKSIAVLAAAPSALVFVEKNKASPMNYIYTPPKTPLPEVKWRKLHEGITGRYPKRIVRTGLPEATLKALGIKDNASR
jgi:hypothetical protein